MDHVREYKKFINGQHLHTGIRVTFSVIIPALLLYHFGLLASFIAVPLGAMCVGLTDNPGPYHHRKNSLIASVLINFFVALVAGFLNADKGLVVTAIIFFGMFFSLIGVYGNRISAIGTIALYVFVFSLENHESGKYVLYNALWFSAGGVWYLLLALLFYRLRPYKIVQQMLGENLAEISNYLQLKAAFYLHNRNEKTLYSDLMKSQVAIQQQQDDLREIMFKTRQFVKESNVKSRTLMIMFLNSIDLFERIITSQQDYKILHEDFDHTSILQKYHTCIKIFADELHHVALTVQKGEVAADSKNIDDAMAATKNAYEQLRKNSLNTKNIEAFIKLKNILDSLEDIAKRIKQLQAFTAYDKKINRQFRKKVDVSKFVTHNEIDLQLLMENITFRSNNFRHALRVTIALLAGYFVSLFFPLGHSYWILLTITTIIKPAYSITKQRNINRLLGTLAGALAGFVILYFISDKTVLFAIMLFCMIIAYSFFRLNYLVSSDGITIYVLLTFYFLNPHSFQAVLSDRVVDTVIGSFIAFIVAAIVLPNWEYERAGEFILKALEANRKYFAAVSKIFANEKYDVNDFKLARKDAFVALANLSDNLQRMLSEPKNKRPSMEEYHQFVATSQLLTSYIASLSYYAQSMNMQDSIEFEPLIEKVDESFQQALNVHQHTASNEITQESQTHILRKKIDRLLAERRNEIANNMMDEITVARKDLFSLQTVSNQFELIDAVVNDEIKILKKIYSA